MAGASQKHSSNRKRRGPRPSAAAPSASKSAKRPRPGPPPRTTPRALPSSPYPFYTPSCDSALSSQRALAYLLSPLTPSAFFATNFQAAPALLRAPARTFAPLLTIPSIKALVLSNTLAHGTDIDVTRYSASSGRAALDLAGAADASDWARFESGACSIRLRRPQEHSEAIWALCSLLEGFFGTVVGANAYLTPASSQGFAPHYDDIDAFICQVSGRKHWKVYAPRGDGCDVLPRRSSVDFSAEDMEGVELVYDEVLEEGDVLYLPRGTVHEASVGAWDEPSLHVTISACQKVSWADFLKDTVAAAIDSAASECVKLRRNVPLGFTGYVGVGFAEADVGRREKFDGSLRKALRMIAEKYPIDAAADMHEEKFMRERLPPWEVEVAKRAGQKIEGEVGVKTSICAAGKGYTRVVMNADGDLPSVVHCFNNSRAAGLLEEDDGRFSCTGEEALAIDGILKAYPEAVRVGDIGLGSKCDKIDLALILVEMGVVVRVT